MTFLGVLGDDIKAGASLEIVFVMASLRYVSKERVPGDSTRVLY